MHINQFPKEVQDFIHELCAKAILRAIREGKYVSVQAASEELENEE
ncbi:hypothetical protein [Paenibacillus sp. FSL K6-1230]